VGRDFDVVLNGVSGAAHSLIINGGSIVSAATTTAVRVNRAAVQTIANATSTVIVFDATSVDQRDEHSTSTGLWVCQVPGNYKVRAQVRFGSLDATGVAVIVRIERNGAVVAEKQCRSAGIADETFEVSDLVTCVAGQTIGASVYQASGLPKDITGGAQYSFLTVDPA
jgi:hypothetical protein